MRLSLRHATMADAALLLAWRNDPLTIAASHTSEPVDPLTHDAWLSRSLSNPDRVLWVAEDASREPPVPVGTVRADREADGMWLLSWTVAPEWRGRGVGTFMVGAAMGELRGGFRCTIKQGNRASERIAERSGFERLTDHNGVSWWERRGLDE